MREVCMWKLGGKKGQQVILNKDSVYCFEVSTIEEQYNQLHITNGEEKWFNTRGVFWFLLV